jgi:WD40 repeat protein/tetratricopeptide (TPR) repeat protein/predicted Ser/Thr protein kinase
VSSPHDPTGSVDPLDAVVADYLQAAEAGTPPDRDALLAAHPELADKLRAFFADYDRVDQQVGPFRLAADPDATSDRDPAPADGVPRVKYFGDYELLAEVARGGMGVVFRARQTSLNRVVALKMILKGVLATEKEVRRFRAEAEAAADLDHPNIVPVYEVGEHDGHQYFAMKFVDGPSLAGLPRAGVREEAARVAVVARAVGYAHRRGILHRDLKPSNVLTGPDGTPFVTDFGLAKRLDGADASLTEPGQPVGTPRYMAPEQAAGAADLTVAADVWGLGAVLYERLTGRPPFTADSLPEVLRQVRETDPAALSKVNYAVPRDLETVCLKCLEKDPARRYPAADALADDLERWLRGEPVSVRPAGPLERAAKWARRYPTRAAAYGLTALVVALTGLTAGAVALWQAAETQRGQAEEARGALAGQKEAADAARAEADRNADKAAKNEAEANGLRRAAVAAKTAADAEIGMSLAEAGNPLDALPHLVHALRATRDDPAGQALHRERLAGVLRQCPRLLWLRHADPGGHTRYVFSPTGRHVLVSHRHELVREKEVPAWAVRLWDTDADAPVAGPWTAIRGGGMSHLVDSTAADPTDAFSPDGRLLVTLEPGAGGAVAVNVRRADTGAVVHALAPRGPVWRATFSPDGARLLTLSRVENGDKRFVHQLWDTTTGTEAAALVSDHPAGDGFFSADGRAAVLVLLADEGRTLPFDPDHHTYRHEVSASGVVVSAGMHLHEPRRVLRWFDAATGAALGEPVWFHPKSYVLPGPADRVVTVHPLDLPSFAKLRVRDAATGRPAADPVLIPTPDADGSPATLTTQPLELAFAPGRTRLLAIAGGITTPWDLATGEPGRAVFWPGDAVEHKRFSPDRRFALGEQKRPGRRVSAPIEFRPLQQLETTHFRVWDWQNERPASPVFPSGSADLTPDGRRVLHLPARTDGRAEARLWDWVPPDLLDPVAVPGNPPVETISPDGRRTFTGGRVIDLATGQVLAAGIAADRPPGKDRYDRASHPVSWFSPDGRFLAVASTVKGGPRGVRVWNADTGVPVGPAWVVPGLELARLAVSGDGRRVAVLVKEVGDEPVVQLWDAATGTRVAGWGKEAADKDEYVRRDKPLPATDARFSPDGRVLAVLGHDRVDLYDAATGAAVRAFELPRISNTNRPGGDQLSYLDRAGLVFAPDGRRVLANAPRSQRVRLLDLDTGAAHPLDDGEYGKDAEQLAFTADGRFALVAWSSDRFRVWDAATGKPAGPAIDFGARGELYTAPPAVSADGRWVAMTAEGTGRVWEVATGRPVTPALRLGGSPDFVEFAPGDRQYLPQRYRRGKGLRVWRAVEHRPTDDLVRYAELLSGRRIDAAGVPASIPADELGRLWQASRRDRPADHALTPADLVAWHRLEAARCLADGSEVWSAAVHHLTRVLAAAPDEVTARADRGRALVALGLHTRALADLDAVLAKTPGDWRSMVRRAECFAGLGEYKKAVAEYTAARALNPAVGRLARAECNAKLGEWAAVVADCTAVVAGQPADLRDRDVLFLRARAYHALGRADEAAADLTAVLKRSDDYDRFCVEPWTWPVGLAVANAAVPKEKLLALEAYRWEKLRSRGRLHAKLGDPKSAAADYSAALHHAGGDRSLNESLRPLWLDWLKARADAEGRPFDPTPVTRLMPPGEAGVAKLSWHREAYLRLAAGDRDGFRRALASWVADKPSRPGDAERAGLDVYRALALVPDPLALKVPVADIDERPEASVRGRAFVGGYGAFLYRTGKDREALAWLTDAVRRDPDGGDAWTCLFLALTHRRLGDATAAGEWWAKAQAARARLERTKAWRVNTAAAVKSSQFVREDVPVVNLRAWWEWVEVELVWPEAEAALNPPDPAAKK